MTLNPARPPKDDHARPLIVTLACDPTSASILTALRRKYFPPQRSFLDAHVTLFHDLPGDEEAEVKASLSELCSSWKPFSFDYGDPTLHGRVVLISLFGITPLAALHAAIRRRWLPRLSNQDKQGFKAHVTILNKTDPEHAKQVHQELLKLTGGRRRSGQAVGLDLWRYMGGPWEHVERFDFGPGTVKEQQTPVKTEEAFPSLGGR